jgi:predicted aldo/keto reductase-like oxidoreductase
VRFLGLTGHHDPAILLDAMGRFDFDTVLVALNGADVHRSSFARSVLAEAARKGMGAIGMKVYAAGLLVRAGAHGLAPSQAMGYVLSLPGVSTVVIGCSSPGEVDQNAQVARDFRPLDEPAMHAIEQHTGPNAGYFTSYKK